MRVVKAFLSLSVVSLLAGCGGSSDSGGTTNPPPATVSTVSLSKTSATLRPTESTSITATPRDASGNALTGRTVTWSISPSSVASIAPNGAAVTVTATANGLAQVTATVEGVQATASITVTNSFPASGQVTVGANGANVFDPAQVDIATGGSVTFTWAGALHNVTWQSPPASVPNSGDRSSGSFDVTFTQAGTYNYQCTLHPGMNGAVTVH
jgi:plastocyanin